MNSRERLFLVALAATCFSVSPLQAQQEEGEKPKPAARYYGPSVDTSYNQQDDQTTQTLQPDLQPLSGLQEPTLGTPAIRHSYWLPGLEYGNTVRSSSLNPGSTIGWNTTSFFSGDLSLLEAWSHALLSANYSGGGFRSTDPVEGSGQYHQLASAFEIDQRRWQVLFVDQFSYLPQSSYGFGGTSGLAAPGIMGALAVSLPSIQSTYVPGQTVLTTLGPRYGDSGAAQLTYALSPRTSITLAGVYDILRFVDPGSLNSDSEFFRAGFDYSLTRKNTIGLIYQFSGYRFPGDPQALGDQLAQIEYGRKVTGKLALKLAGGPDITTFRVPIGGSTERISASGSASLTYAFPRSSLALSYMHGISGGSGVFTGSDIDQLSATYGRPLTRVWTGSINFGYAENRQILTASGSASPIYDTYLVGAGLNRPIGRTTVFSLAYQASLESSNVAICNKPGCGTDYTVHQIFVTLQWHTRPLVLR